MRKPWRYVIASLILVAGSCAGIDKTAPEHRGARGESCQARNDCQSDLACFNGICTENDFNIAVGAKQCFRIECSEKADCCGEGPPADCDNQESICSQPYAEPGCSSSYITCASDDDCSDYAGQSCSTSGYCTCDLNPDYDPSSDICTTDICSPCNLDCVDEMCVAVCESDDDCAGTSLPFCDSGTCVRCTQDDDCTGADEKCMAGACVAPCKQNEQCPLFNECDADTGECKYVGCTDDHECQFAYEANGNQDARSALCVDNPLAGQAGQPEKVCRVPCVSDAECGRRELCDNGSCVYMGCESDEECRAQLGLANEEAPANGAAIPKAVCREP